jgi:hypothetical protein
LPTLRDAAADRSRDRAVAQLDAQIIEHRLIGLDRRPEHIRLRPGIIEIGDWRGTLGYEVGVPTQVALGALELRLVARDVALRLADLRLERAGVELQQHIAGLDARAVSKMDCGDLVIEARFDCDARHGRDGAKCVDLIGNDLPLGLTDFDRHRTRLRGGLRDRPLRAQEALQIPLPARRRGSRNGNHSQNGQCASSLHAFQAGTLRVP